MAGRRRQRKELDLVVLEYKGLQVVEANSREFKFAELYPHLFAQHHHHRHVPEVAEQIVHLAVLQRLPVEEPHHAHFLLFIWLGMGLGVRAPFIGTLFVQKGVDV